MEPMSKTPRRGRPPLPKSQARTAERLIAFTPKENRTLKAMAKAGKKTVAETIREKVFAAQPGNF